MSKICENCGNMIPEGADVCPGCGRQQYSDDTLQAVLNDLSLALDEIQKDDSDAVPTQEVSGDTMEFKMPEADNEPAEMDPAIAAIADAARTAGTPKKAKKIDNSDAVRASAPKASAKKKKKKKKGSSGSTIIAIILGILIALVLVSGAALFMLYKMGFFDLLTDAELLQTDTSTVEETMETLPSATPELVIEAPVASVEEPVEASIVEESVLEDSILEEVPSDEEEEAAPENDDEEGEENEGASDVDVDKFTLTGSDSFTLNYRGETVQVSYIVYPEEAEWAIDWESSDETVATVNSIGVITARRGGDCYITGTCGEFEVKVQIICNFTVPETVLDMNYSDITMDHEGQEVQMKIDYDLTAEQIEATVWESSDPAVATVDEDGLVTAVANGTVVISASIGDYTASCIVRCVNVTGNKGVNPDDSEFVINYEDVTLSRKGEYFQLSLKSVLGNDLPEFEWESSDSSIATVDSKGIVTAVADGTCKITTTVGEDKFECIVRVRITG